ncbi:hypothetical protein ACIHDR_49125 [Nocardia sp. NPDC052278]|uniref:hypothetical protein n=1 Tax=unclassified Nocardia TaxID=2637762 RepID=UPI0036829EFA
MGRRHASGPAPVRKRISLARRPTEPSCLGGQRRKFVPARIGAFPPACRPPTWLNAHGLVARPAENPFGRGNFRRGYTANREDRNTPVEHISFLDQISYIDYLFETNRVAARHAFFKALEFATPQDRAFLERMAEMYSTHKFANTNIWLESVKKAEPHLAECIDACAPLTDPTLYQRRLLDQQWDAIQNPVALEVAEMPRMPIRDYYRAPNLKGKLTKAIDDARFDKEKLRRRIQQRPRVRPEGELPEREDPIVADYCATMFTDSVAEETALPEWQRPPVEDEAALRAAADRDPRVVANRQRAEQARRIAAAAAELRREADNDTPRRARGKDDADAQKMWDGFYVSYVAEQYDDAARDLWDSQNAIANNQRRDAAANTYLRDGSDVAKRRAAAQTKPRRGRISDEEREAFAAARTKLRTNGDAREQIPFQGNGIDMIHQAMSRVVGWRCVSCFIERCELDNLQMHHRGGRRVSDDGLCDLCREDGRPGIPPAPGAFTTEEFVLSRCRFIANAYPGAARAILGDVWRRAAPHPMCKVITTFLRENPGLPGQPVLASKPSAARSTNASAHKRGPARGANQHQRKCDGCLTYCTVNNEDGFCSACRIRFGLVEVAPTVKGHSRARRAA